MMGVTIALIWLGWILYQIHGELKQIRQHLAPTPITEG